MNTILIGSDTMRPDFLGCGGWAKAVTPNLDRLAAEGCFFERSLTGSYATVPARGDVVTGKYVFPNHGWEPLTYTDRTCAKILGEHGFITQLYCDTPHIMKDGFHYDKGFTGWEFIRGQESDRYVYDHNFKFDLPCDEHKLRNPHTTFRQHLMNISRRRGEEDTFAATTLGKGIDWLKHNYGLDNFFLWCDTFDPHEPWDAPQYYVDLYDPGYTGQVIPYPAYGPASLFTKREIEHCRALYAAEVTLVDRWVGKLLDAVDDLGLADDTLVIVWSDHGFMLGEHGLMGKGSNPLYAELNRCVFIARCPGGKSGLRSQAFAQAADIAPTILDAAGVEIPADCHGKSLLPVLTGKQAQVRDLMVSSWPITTNPNAPTLSVITDEDWSLHYTGPGGKHELFSVDEDPAQKRNLYRKNKDVAARLLARYVEFLREADCPEGKLELRSKL
jgi:arylsulfatase A-like enzyme